jgi:pyruvate,water dikinase
MDGDARIAAKIQRETPAEFRFIRFFSEIGVDDVPLVGGKNASLGEMYRELTAAGLRIPNGFAITAEGYRYTLESAGLFGKLHEALQGLEASDISDLAKRALRAREIIYGAPCLPTCSRRRSSRWRS